MAITKIILNCLDFSIFGVKIINEEFARPIFESDINYIFII